MSSHRNVFSVHSSIYRDSPSVRIFIQSIRDCNVIIQERRKREIHLKNVSPSLASLHRCSLCEVTWHPVTQPTFWFGAAWIRMMWYSLIILHDLSCDPIWRTNTRATENDNKNKQNRHKLIYNIMVSSDESGIFLFSYTIKCCSIVNLLCSSQKPLHTNSKSQW